MQKQVEDKIAIISINQNIEKKNQFQDYIVFTYRSNIEAVEKTTYYTSDAGWGCMLRVAQMFLANLLYKYEKMPKLAVVQLFYDNLLVPFSIQNFTLKSKISFDYMKNYQWFTPCQASFLIKILFEDFQPNYSINICNDNSIFMDQIQTGKQNVVIMLMARIGMNQPQPGYLKCVLKMMQSPYFLSILGGTPKRAHLFLEYNVDKKALGYLDPHKNQISIPKFNDIGKHLKQYEGSLEWINQQYIDSSMAITFKFKKQQIELFWIYMQKLKLQLKDDFFVYIDKCKPKFEIDFQNCLIQIEDD